jgi:hypothetical protein
MDVRPAQPVEGRLFLLGTIDPKGGDYNPLDALQHAGRQCRQKQCHRVHRIAPPGKIGVKRDLRVLRHGEAAMRRDAAGVDAVFY